MSSAEPSECRRVCGEIMELLHLQSFVLCRCVGLKRGCKAVREDFESGND